MKSLNKVMVLIIAIGCVLLVTGEAAASMQGQTTYVIEGMIGDGFVMHRNFGGNTNQTNFNFGGEEPAAAAIPRIRKEEPKPWEGIAIMFLKPDVIIKTAISYRFEQFWEALPDQRRLTFDEKRATELF